MFGFIFVLFRSLGFGSDATYPHRVRNPAGGLGLSRFGLVAVNFIVCKRASMSHVMVVWAKWNQVPDLVPTSFGFGFDVVNIHKKIESANCAASPVFPVRQCAPMGRRVLNLHEAFTPAFFPALFRAVLVFPSIQVGRDNLEWFAARCAGHLNPFSHWVVFAAGQPSPVLVPACGAAIAARLYARLSPLKRLFAVNALLLDARLSIYPPPVVARNKKSFWFGFFSAPASAKIFHSLKRLTKV